MSNNTTNNNQLSSNVDNALSENMNVRDTFEGPSIVKGMVDKLRALSGNLTSVISGQHVNLRSEVDKALTSTELLLSDAQELCTASKGLLIAGKDRHDDDEGRYINEIIGHLDSLHDSFSNTYKHLNHLHSDIIFLD